jgi:hypothetical protein
MKTSLDTTVAIIEKSSRAQVRVTLGSWRGQHNGGRNEHNVFSLPIDGEQREVLNATG